MNDRPEKVPVETMILTCMDSAEYYERMAENFKFLRNADPEYPASKARIFRAMMATLELLKQFEGEFVAVVRSAGPEKRRKAGK